MKNIAEIQHEIQEITGRLEELRREMDDLKPKGKADAEINFAKIKRLAKANPLCQHKLFTAEKYQKKLYLQLLMAIVQTNPDEREDKLICLLRIAEGMGYEATIEELLKGGLEIDGDLIDEFIAAVEDQQARQLFIFEALLLSSLSGEMDSTARQYISDLTNYLAIDKTEMLFLIKLAACTLEQNMKKYEYISNQVPENIDIMLFCELYLKSFVKGIVCDTESMYFVSGVDVDIVMQKKINAADFAGKKIVFKDCKFLLQTATEKVNFKKCESISFERCRFAGGGYGFVLKDVDDIRIKDCSFVEFTKRVIETTGSSNAIRIEGSTFKRCGYQYNRCDIKYGGCIKGARVTQFYIKSSSFKDCYIKNERHSSIYGAIVYIEDITDFAVEDTVFENCNCYCNTTNSEPGNGLFYIESYIEQEKQEERFTACQRINSAELVSSPW